MTQTPPPAEGLEKAFALNYITMGWALVVMELGSKGPKSAGWNTPANAIRTAHQVEQAFAAGPMNQGLQHGYSNTCALDIDHLEYSKIVYGEMGLDLEALLDQGLRIKGKEGRAKAIFSLPPGVVLPFIKITWQKPDARHVSDVVTLFEMRSGMVQDVLPPSVHPDGHRYEWVEGHAPWNHAGVPVLPQELVEFWSRLQSMREEIDNLCPWKPPAAIKRPQMRARPPVEGHGDIIGKFNAANSVEAMLSLGGYVKKGRRWLAPSSSTKLPGVVVFKDGPHERVYSHHGSDPLADGYAHDAFDLYVLFVHAGNVAAALRAAAMELGIERDGPAPDIDLSNIQPFLTTLKAQAKPVVPDGQKLEAVAASQAPGAEQRGWTVDPETGVVHLDEPKNPPPRPAVDQTHKPNYVRGAMPEGLLHPGGFIEGLMEYQMATAPMPVRVLAFASSLMAAATALGGKVCSPSRLRTNLYVVALAPSGGGKEYGRETIKRLFSAAGQGGKLLGPEKIVSGAGLLSRVSKAPNAVWMIDEFGMFMKRMKGRGASSHLAEVEDEILKLHSSTNSVTNGPARADEKLNPSTVLDCPCMQIYGTSTAHTFFDSISTKDSASGLLNRLLIFAAPDEHPDMRFIEQTPIPQDLVDWVNAAQNLICGAQGTHQNNPVVIHMDAMAEAVIKGFSSRANVMKGQAVGSGIDEIWARSAATAIKLAMIYCCNELRPDELLQAAANGALTVNGTHATRAVETVQYCIDAFTAECSESLADNEFDLQRKAVLKYIRKAGPSGASERYLFQSCGAWKTMNDQTRKSVKETLRSDGEIFEVVGAKSENGRRLKIRYFAREFFGQGDHDD